MNDQLSGLTPSQRDTLRLAGAVLFAAGIFVLLIRKGDEWADFPVLLVVAIPCVLLYGLGVGAIQLGRDDAATDGLSAWRATALVLGIIFVALTLSQLVDTIGGDSEKSGWVFFIFLLTALAAAHAAFTHRLRYGALLAGLSLIVSWVALWDAIFDPSATAIRWLFVIIGVLLAAAAYTMYNGDRRAEGTELVTAAGIAGLAAGVTALFAVAGALIGGAISSAFGTEPDLSGGIQQRDEWDVFLLLIAVALIWFGAKAPWRGPAYVGGFALFAFVISAGTDIASLVQGDEPSHDVIGWPALLLVLGGATLAAGLLGGGGGTARPERAAATAPTEPMPPADPGPPPGP